MIKMGKIVYQKDFYINGSLKHIITINNEDVYSIKEIHYFFEDDSRSIISVHIPKKILKNMIKNSKKKMRVICYE